MQDVIAMLCVGLDWDLDVNFGSFRCGACPSSIKSDCDVHIYLYMYSIA